MIDPTWREVLADPVRVDVLFALCASGSGTAGDIARHCHATERTVRRHLEALAALGLARETRPAGIGGERPGRPAIRFILDHQVRMRAQDLLVLLRQPLAPSRQWSPRPRGNR